MSILETKKESKDVEKLVRLYKKQIVLPKVRSKKKILLCPVGHIGSGKTTVIKPLSKKLHLVRISTDELRILARDNNLSLQVGRIVINLVSHFLSKGYSVACDFDCSTLEKRELLEGEAILHLAHVVFIKVNPPKAWILHKVKNLRYKKTGLFPSQEVGVSEVKRSFKERTLPKLSYAYIFNPAKDNLKEQIRECAKKLTFV